MITSYGDQREGRARGVSRAEGAGRSPGPRSSASCATARAGGCAPPSRISPTSSTRSPTPRSASPTTVVGIEKFQAAATSASSPILGPSRLSAQSDGRLRDGERRPAAHHGAARQPRADVPRRGRPHGRARRRGVRAVDPRDRQLREPGQRGDRQQLRGHRLVRLVQARLQLPRRADRRARPGAAAAHLRRPDVPRHATTRTRSCCRARSTSGSAAGCRRGGTSGARGRPARSYGQRVYDIYQRMVRFAATDPAKPKPKPVVAKPGDTTTPTTIGRPKDSGPGTKKP